MPRWNAAASPEPLRALWGAARLAIGLGLLYLAVRDVDLDGLRQAAGNARPAWLLLVLFTVLATAGLKGWRWHLLLAPVAPSMGYLRTLGALLIGQAGNILLPLRGGDLLRAGVASAADAGRAPAVVTGLMIEKGLDALALLLALTLAVPLLPPEAALQGAWRGLLLAGAGGLALAFAAIVFSPRLWPPLRRRLQRLNRPIFSRAQILGDRFTAGLLELRRAGGYPGVLALTGLSWLAMYATNAGMIYALGIPAPPEAGLLVLVLVFLGIIPRLMPGQVGPFYFFARLALEQYGVEPAASAAYAVLLHAFFLAPPLLGAGFYLLVARGRRAARSAVGG